MRYSSLHTHSTFCDGIDTIETLCRTAYEKGLSAIGLSSHAPLHDKTGLYSDWHLRDDQLTIYLDTVHEARTRWAGKLSVFAGLEVDYIKGMIGPSDFHNAGLDYIIGSVHYVVPPCGEPFTVDASPTEFAEGLHRGFSGDAGALVNTYWDAVEAMISAGGFDIVAHIDLIKKNNRHHQWFSPEDTAYQCRLNTVAKMLAGSSLVVEVNTGGLNRGTTDELYPSTPLLQLLYKNAVPVVITADAHRACDLDNHYTEALNAICSVGYTTVMFFEGLENRWVTENIS